MEIAGGGRPGTPEPALPTRLAIGAQPQPLGRAGRRARAQVIVGGAGLGERLDQDAVRDAGGQKSDRAAARLAAPSAGIRK